MPTIHHKLTMIYYRSYYQNKKVVNLKQFDNSVDVIPTTFTAA